MTRLPATAENISRAAQKLSDGELVAFPTETVYGLGGDATNPQTVAQIYATKQRPSFNPLIIHVGDREMAAAIGILNETAQLLADKFWPGPLTLIVPRQTDCPVCELACAGLPTIALRMPAHETARHLLASVKRPLAAPSANLSGQLSPTLAHHVVETLPEIDVLDGGAAGLGLESTIISCLEDRPVRLRKGSLARRDIELATGLPLDDLPEDADKEIRLAPGRLARHYAPAATLRLRATTMVEGEAVLGFGPDVMVPEGAAYLNLSPSGDTVEAAANLFAYLHELDSKATRIAVSPIPDSGLGEAINDRLNRACDK